MVKKLILFLAVVNLYATNINEPSVFDMMDRDGADKFVNKPEQIKPKRESKPLTAEQIEKIQGIMPTDELDLSIPESSLYETIKKKDIVLKIVNMPTSVIIGEIFKFDVVLNTQSEFEFELNSNIDETNVKWLNKNNMQWVKSSDSDSIYTATIYLQAKNTSAKSTRFSIELTRNSQEYQKSSLNVFLPKLKELKTPIGYNGIVADSLEVKKFKTTKFDDTSNIMIVELIGKNVVLSSFYLNDKTIIKQGVDTIVGDFGNQSAYYFAVFKPNKKSLDFNYYNIKKEKFDSFSLPVSVEDDEISTQIGLNPKQSDITIYKNITIYSLAGILLLFCIFRRKISYFIAFALVVAFGIYSYNPFRKAVLKPEVSVKILPTTNSTIFYISKDSENVEILMDRDDYIKILFGDGKIGWVKKDDVIKN